MQRCARCTGAGQCQGPLSRRAHVRFAAASAHCACVLSQLRAAWVGAGLMRPSAWVARHKCAHTHTRTRAHTYTHAHTYTRTHRQSHTHTQVITHTHCVPARVHRSRFWRRQGSCRWRTWLPPRMACRQRRSASAPRWAATCQSCRPAASSCCPPRPSSRSVRGCCPGPTQATGMCSRVPGLLPWVCDRRESAKGSLGHCRLLCAWCGLSSQQEEGGG